MSFVSRGFRGRRTSDADAARLPPGQYLTPDFPVLSAGPTPRTALDQWSFTIEGLVDKAKTWSWAELTGNGIAGVLAEAFGTDMTSVPRRCDGCSVTAALGAYRVYRGAGYALCCPSCHDVARRIGVFDTAMTVTATGVLTLPRAD